MILRATLSIICILLTANNIQATYPFEFDESTEKLLIDSIGQLMNETSNAYQEDPTYPEFSDEHYRQRFAEMSGAIDFKLTKEIKAQILYRVNKIRSSTERTLGLTEMYFPIFEEYLAKKGMPRYIKYLPIVESNLNPVARSRAAAVGLWQFIPGTGRLYGLRVASYLDERSDTHKATDAATTMLSNLYKRYGDWCLALAAYNCGPGRIDKLVKAKGYNYWVVRKYLPRETQMYVPLFMAVAYTYEYHAMHQLKARRVESDLILTDTLHLPDGYKSLSSLATKYEISRDKLKRLNPVYVKNYVPSSGRNNILVLPSRIVAKEKGLEDQYNRLISIDPQNPIKCIRRVSNEQELRSLCQAHLCTLEDVFFWNRFPNNYKIQPNDLVAFRKYYAPKDTKYNPLNTRKAIQGIKIPSLKVVGLDDRQEKAVTSPVYIDIKKKKLASQLAVNTPSAVKNGRKTRSTTTVNKMNSSQKILERVSKDRTRGRRLRTKERPKATTSATYQSTGIPAAKASSSKTAQENKVTTEVRLMQIQQLGQQLQEKEKAAIDKEKAQTTDQTLKVLERQRQELELKKKENSTLPARTRNRNLR